MCILFLLSCEKNELQRPPVDPGRPEAVKASFASDVTGIAEQVSELNIPIEFSTPTSKEEIIVFNVSISGAEYGKDFITVPATVDDRIQIGVAKGDRGSNIKVVPINNDRRDGERSFRIAISNNGTIKPGNNAQLQLSILDDEP